MHDNVDREGFKQTGHRGPIADVQIVMGKAPAGGFELAADGCGVAAGTEKVRAHVVVDAMHVRALRIEKPDRFGPDQPAAARH